MSGLITFILAFANVLALIALVVGLINKRSRRSGRNAGGGSPGNGDEFWLKFGLALLSVTFGLGLLWACYLVLDGPNGCNMPNRMYQIVRMAVGLAGGFIAAGLSGSFEVTGTWPTVTIKGAGPIAVAVFFYLVNPMALTADPD